MKMWKVYDNANDNEDDDNNNGQQTNFDQKSSLEPLGSGELKIGQMSRSKCWVPTERFYNREYSCELSKL